MICGYAFLADWETDPIFPPDKGVEDVIAWLEEKKGAA
jgi:hypothetical protein